MEKPSTGTRTQKTNLKLNQIQWNKESSVVVGQNYFTEREKNAFRNNLKKIDNSKRDKQDSITKHEKLGSELFV